MATRLPLDDLPANPDGVAFRIELSGDVFGLEFRLNQREDRYYLHVTDENGDTLASSVAVVPGRALLWSLNDPRRPGGDFFVVTKDGSTADREPTSGELGLAFDVVFLTAQEMAE